MSDHDRGAYAPQNEAPLAFDPRYDDRRRGPAPLTLIVSVLVLLALAAGVMLLYRHGVRKPGAPPQVVGAPLGDTKTAAPAGAQSSEDETAGLQVYKTEAVPTSEATPGPAPDFIPTPEQPRPRPVAVAPPPPPPVAVQTLRPAEPAPAAPVAAPHPAAPIAKKPITVAMAKPRPSTLPSPDSDVAGSAFAAESGDTTVAEAAKKPAKVLKPAISHPPGGAAPSPKGAMPSPKGAAPSADGAVLVQIGAFSSSALAQEGAGQALSAAPHFAAGKTRRVETTSKDGKTFYRGLIGGFASKADAVKFCAALKAAGKSCIVR